MKSHLLRTSAQRSLRLTLHVAAAHRWCPLPLTWQRRERRAQPTGGRVSARTVHQHQHVALHLHFASAAPNTRLTVGTGPASINGSLTARTVTTFQCGRRELAVRHLHVHNTFLHRQAAKPATQPPRRVQLVTSAHDHSTDTHTHTHSYRSVSGAAGHLFVAAPGREGAPSATLPRAPRVLAPAPSAARAPALEQSVPAGMRASAVALALVWRAAPTDPRTAAEDISETSPVTATASSPTTASMRTATPVTAPVTAIQARDAVRANLLDPAVADRLADDVIRRVEKRMRIERERRGI
jgi:hypothetical protein